jgi:hypothetical protein
MAPAYRRRPGRRRLPAGRLVCAPKRLAVPPRPGETYMLPTQWRTSRTPGRVAVKTFQAWEAP